MDIIKHILVATDFSDAAGHALDYALELAHKHDARLTVLHIYEIPAIAYTDDAFTLDIMKNLEDAAREQLDRVMRAVHERLPAAQSILKLGSASDMVASQAERAGADLIVMGTHGRHGLSHIVLGSVAEKTLRHAKVPVLILHAPATKKASKASPAGTAG